MASETRNLHVSKNFNISETKQDVEKMKPHLIRLVRKCCSDAFKTGSTIFSLRWRLNFELYIHYTINALSMSRKRISTARHRKNCRMTL